jgi:hypothetical protein
MRRKVKEAGWVRRRKRLREIRPAPRMTHLPRAPLVSDARVRLSCMHICAGRGLTDDADDRADGVRRDHGRELASRELALGQSSRGGEIERQKKGSLYEQGEIVMPQRGGGGQREEETNEASSSASLCGCATW